MGIDFETHVWLWKVTLVNIRRFKYHCIIVEECVWVYEFGCLCGPMCVQTLVYQRVQDYDNLSIYLRLVMISVTASPFFPVSIFRQIFRSHLVFLFPFFCFNICNCTFRYVDDDYQGNVCIYSRRFFPKTINRKSEKDVEGCLFIERAEKW